MSFLSGGYLDNEQRECPKIIQDDQFIYGLALRFWKREIKKCAFIFFAADRHATAQSSDYSVNDLESQALPLDHEFLLLRIIIKNDICLLLS